MRQHDEGSWESWTIEGEGAGKQLLGAEAGSKAGVQVRASGPQVHSRPAHPQRGFDFAPSRPADGQKKVSDTGEAASSGRRVLLGLKKKTGTKQSQLVWTV